MTGISSMPERVGAFERQHQDPGRPNDVEHVSFTVPSKPGRYYFSAMCTTLINGFLTAR